MAISPYLKLEKEKVNPLRGDPAAMFWYVALTEYSSRLSRDRNGYVRISKKIIEEDYGFSRDQVKYLDKKLIKSGVIITDKKKGGGRTPTGYKIIK